MMCDYQEQQVQTQLGRMLLRRWIPPATAAAGGSRGGVILCVNGFGDHSETFVSIAQHMAAERGSIVLAFDWLNRVGSDVTDRAFTAEFYQEQLDALIAVVPELATSSSPPFGVFGHSMGGYIAVQFAARVPDRVRFLILAAPAGLMPKTLSMSIVHTFKPLGMVRKVLGDEVKQDRIFTAGGGASKEYRASPAFEASVEGMRRQFRRTETIGGVTVRPIVEAMASTAVNFPLTASKASRNCVAQVGAHPRPVLILWGEKDIAVPYKPCARAYTKRMPRAILVTYPNTGHVPFSEDPARTHGALMTFLETAWRA